jgi:hypothetical protein
LTKLVAVTQSIQPSISQLSVTQSSVAQLPIAQLPVTQPPITQPPITQLPITQLPITQLPITQLPITQPSTQLPVAEDYEMQFYSEDNNQEEFLEFSGLGNQDSDSEQDLLRPDDYLKF